jgi:hypothetical protein
LVRALEEARTARVIPAERVAAAVHGHPVFANERFSDVSVVREAGTYSAECLLIMKTASEFRAW